MSGKGAYRRAGKPRFCKCGLPLKRDERVKEHDRRTGEPSKMEVTIRCSAGGYYDTDVHDLYRWERKATKQEKRNTDLWEPLPIMGRKAKE